nr:unnamed protein product [Callosobruchus analis]
MTEEEDQHNFIQPP